MNDIIFFAVMLKGKGLSSLLIVAGTLMLAAIFLSQLVLAHLLENGKGLVNAFNFDEAVVAHLNADCSYRYECKRTDAKDTFFYKCYYDVQSSECQCSKGIFSSCNVSSSSLDAPTAAALKRHYSGRVSILVLAGGIFGKFNSLPILVKIAIVAVAVAAVIFVFARLRDAYVARNFRKAESLHTEAAKLHEKGDEEEAKLLFEKSNYYRERGYDQLNQKV